MAEITFTEYLKETIIAPKEFIIDVKDKTFTVNSTNIEEFVYFLHESLGNEYMSLGLGINFNLLSVGETHNSYFPHMESPIHFPNTWSKKGLPYSIKRLS